MLDVLAIGFGIGYGRISARIPVTIDAGGWCFLAAALLTLATRACLDRRAVWQAVDAPPGWAGPDPVTCTSCLLVNPPALESQPCPRCAARLEHRRPFSALRCTALVAACWFLMPVAYTLPMSEIWMAGTPHPHSIVDGIQLLVSAGFWPLAILIFSASVGIPFGKLIGLTWFLTSVHTGSGRWLRRKTRVYRVIADIGRWSNLDPFTVMIFAPMVQLGELAHIDVLGGSLAFLSMVVLSMLAADVFDPRLMWDAAEAEHGLALLAGGH
jgi:paraquat-inducible protein A